VIKRYNLIIHLDKQVSIFAIIDMNGSTDYLEIFGQVNTKMVVMENFMEHGAAQSTYFGAYRIGS
jgi:hypothetical protein